MQIWKFAYIFNTVVHSAVFMGHLAYACVVVVLIFHNDNSLIMRRELTSIHYRNIWENIMRLIINLFIECLATQIVGTYKHLAEITEKPEKQCLQKWRQNSDFWRFLIINISKLSHRIIIIFFLSNTQLGSFWLSLCFCDLHFFTMVIVHSLNRSFAQKSCPSAHFGGQKSIL